MTRKKPAKLQAYDLHDGSAKWFVRGTEDVAIAFKTVMSEYPECTEDLLPEEDIGYDLEFVPDVERVGWFRFSPCHCGEHGWHLDLVNGPGRGRFLGVWLNIVTKELQFESDNDLTDLFV